MDTALLRTHVSTTALTELTQENVMTATDLFLFCSSQAEVVGLLKQIDEGAANKKSAKKIVFEFIQTSYKDKTKQSETPTDPAEKSLPPNKEAETETGTEEKPNSLAGKYRTLLSSLALEQNLGLVLNYRFKEIPDSAGVP